MNSNYLKAVYRLKAAQAEIQTLWNIGQHEHKTFEDRQAYYHFENVLASMEVAITKLERYTLPVVEGVLVEDRCIEKFQLARNDTGRSLGWFFSCGSYLEVYDQDTNQWYPGRVEYTTRNGQAGYYFFNHDLEHPFLYTGMKARIRKAN